MGQVLIKQETVGVLGQSGATVNIGLSKIILGGLQYNVPATSLNIGSPTANTLYYLYLAYNGSTVTFVQSTNPNSVGPVGYTSWKLVGAYYSNGVGTPAFGSFINVDGPPISKAITYTPVLTTSGGGAITLNATGVINPTGYWCRFGDQIKMFAGFRNGTGGTATGAAGGVKISIPSPFVGNTGNGRVSDGNYGSFVATGGAYKGGAGADNLDYYFVYDQQNISAAIPATGSVWAVANLLAQVSMSVDTTFGVIGWGNTSLRDL